MMFVEKPWNKYTITMNIRAVFLDLDGTLISFNTHDIPFSARKTLFRLKEKGILLFAATGRGKDGLAILEGLPFDGFITLNGQYCYTTDGTILYENTIIQEDLEVLLKELDRHPFPCGFVTRNTKVFNYRDARVEEVHAITHNDGHPAGDISGILQEPVYQIMTFLNESEEKELLKKMPHCTSARWYPTFCDISPLGGTKVKGIDVFCDYFGIPLSAVMAVGDGGNDKEMLKHVHLAAAMGNAPEDVREIADLVTADTDHDGIWKLFRDLDMI